MKTISTLLISICLLAFSSHVLSEASAHHLPGIFVGYTHAQSETVFTYGIEYEYKFNQFWGIGFVYEKANDAHHGDGVTVKVAQLLYHPLKNFRLGVGAGTERIGGEHSHTENLYRLSASYEYHVGDFAIEPTFAVDFIDNEKAYVFGAAFIRPF
jgi:hypothetical protein